MAHETDHTGLYEAYRAYVPDGYRLLDEGEYVTPEDVYVEPMASRQGGKLAFGTRDVDASGFRFRPGKHRPIARKV